MFKALFITAIVLSLSLLASAKNSILDDTAPLRLQEGELADKDFIFNLAGSTPSASGAGGRQFAKTRENARGLRLGNGNNGGPGTQVRFIFEPCGFRTPHHHPRGTENFYVIRGKVAANFIRENDGSMVRNILNAGFSGFFPQGHYHFVQNVGCEEAETIAMFDNSDEGVIDVANVLRFTPDTIEPTLGAFNLRDDDKLIENVLQQSQECLKRCGLSYQKPKGRR